MISPKDERLNFKEKGARSSRVLSNLPSSDSSRPQPFDTGKTAPEKRMKDKELLKIPKQVRGRMQSPARLHICQ
jgi:hypothetical protein